MAAPEEVVAAPLTIYLAEVGTDFPTVDADPGEFDEAWSVLGTEGDLNYDDAGVTVAHSETTADFTPAGSTMPTKRFRTGESMTITLSLVDISPDTYAKVMNDAEVTTVAPGPDQAGEEYFSLYRGDQVNQFAVLARGLSPANNDMNQQYEFSKAFVSVNGNAVFKNGTPVALPVSIQVVRASGSDVMINRVQTADPS